MLEAAAEKAELTGRIRAFLAWVGPGRKLTATGRIGLADARHLVELLGTGDTIDPEIGDPAAASAIRKSEERLRTLHPFAMARYDRLRSQGASPLDAMREAAPLFGLHPRASRAGPPGARDRCSSC